MAVRYYRDNYGWNMSDQSATGCLGLGCLNLYDRCVTNTAANPGVTGIAGQAPQTPALPLSLNDQKNAIHIFFGENPGSPGTATDAFGNAVTRYGTGGAASDIPSMSVIMRGHYWSLRNHPFWSPQGQANPFQASNPSGQQTSFRYTLFNLAHELGHCLGLNHAFSSVTANGMVYAADDCSTVYNDPPDLGVGTSNNLMDYPSQPGFSLSQCQIGAMHYALSNASASVPAIDDAQVRDHWTTLPAQTNVITRDQTWSSVHNLRGNLYVNAVHTLLPGAYHYRLETGGVPVAHHQLLVQ